MILIGILFLTLILGYQARYLKFHIGLDYLLQFALPQVLFHVTTAHGIMRNQGVDIGKRDFLGKMDVK